MQFNKGFRFLLYVIDVYSKHAWVTPLKDKKGITITNTFQKCLDESNRKSGNVWCIVHQNIVRYIPIDI